MSKFASGTLIVMVLLVGGIVAYKLISPRSTVAPHACTTEAKLCPDGSAVGRTGPDCSFAACPEATSTVTSGSGQGIAPFKSGIRGTVLLGPTCPVEQNPPNPGCADKPYATVLTIYHTGIKTPFIIGTSDASGAFSYALPPGDYTITAGSGKQLPYCTPQSVTVPPAEYATTSISCDTGIR